MPELRVTPRNVLPHSHRRRAVEGGFASQNAVLWALLVVAAVGLSQIERRITSLLVQGEAASQQGVNQALAAVHERPRFTVSPSAPTVGIVTLEPPCFNPHATITLQ